MILTVDAPGYVFAATQTAGVFRSTDKGSTWEAVNTGLNWAYLSTFAVDSSNVLYTGSNVFPGFFRTTDEGESWTRTNLPGGAQIATIISGDRLCVGGTQSVSISTDRGDSWSSSIVTSDPVSVLSIAEDSLGNIYAGLQAIWPRTKPPYGGGVYISSDSGRTWHLYGLELTSILSIARAGNGRMFILVPSGILSAVPKDSNWTRDVLGLPSANVASLFTDHSGDLIAATNSGDYKYILAHGYWTQVTPALSEVNVAAAWYEPGTTEYVITERNGVFKLDAANEDWAQCGIVPSQVLSLGRDQAGNFYAGTNDGIYKPAAPGTWIRVSNGLNYGSVYSIRSSSFLGRIYASTSGGSFYSSDSGRSWNTLYPGWSFDLIETRIDQMFVSSTGSVVSSSNGGHDWSRPNDISLPSTNIYCLSAGSDGSIYAGTMFDGVFQTTDGGNFWNQVGLSSPLMFNTVRVLQIDPGGRMFAGTDSFGAYYSDNEGVDWTHIPSLGNSDISSFLVNQEGNYFAGTLDRGVFISTDRGETWTNVDQGLTDQNVLSILMDPQGYLYAGTDSGVFRSTGVITAAIRTTPRVYSLKQNFPNPFNPATVISYKLPANSFVTLKVYDLIGREITTLVNGLELAGEHDVRFDGREYASGVYFYRIIVLTGSGPAITETRRMLLLK